LPSEAKSQAVENQVRKGNLIMQSMRWLPVLAQVSREEFGRGFRGAASQLSWLDLIPYVAAAVLIGAGVTGYRQLKKRNDMSEPCDDPHKLFRELCLAHQLDRASRRLLLQLAEACRFAHPAQVFLTPAAFEPGRLPSALRSRTEEVRRLGEQLFHAA
jgi:hypothetical protein